MRVTLMHNPKAGNGEHAKKELMTALEKAGHRAIYQSTKKKHYQKALKKRTDVVLAAGGDGTVGKVGRELIDSGVPLSVLPLGTANNLARTLNLNGDAEKVIKQLKRGKKHAFDVGVACGPWGKKYFFEAVGGGLLADYVEKAKREDKKNLSKEQELTRHVSLLRRMLQNYPARKWKIEIDGKEISGRYLLWEAMNIRSIGPGLHLAPPALIQDGYLDFVYAREEDRHRFINYLDGWLAGRKKQKFPLPLSRFRNLKVEWNNSPLHFDGKVWPKKNKKSKNRGKKIEITVKPSALIILQPRLKEQS
jgi:diacylglycerol kinase (ATP)